MASLKQISASLVVLLLALGVWLRLDETPGSWLRAQGWLPGPARSVVASLSIAPEGERIEGTRGTERRAAALAPLVRVEPAGAAVARNRLTAVATAEALRTVALYPEIAGIVADVLFRPGGRVEAGEVLLRLEASEQELGVDQARLALEATEAQVVRTERLIASSAASVASVQLEDERRAVEAAALELRAAEIALSRRELRSPIAGRVGLTSVEPGALVGTDTLVVRIDDRSRLRLFFYAPQSYAQSIRQGQPITATPSTPNGQSFEGLIRVVDSRIDEASRTLRVEALVENPDDVLQPGMSFTLTLDLEGEEFLTIDPLAVQWERAGPYVWVLTPENTVRKASVEIVERAVDSLLFASTEVALGDPIVVEGLQLLNDGIEVRLDSVRSVPPVADAERGEGEARGSAIAERAQAAR